MMNLNWSNRNNCFQLNVVIAVAFAGRITAIKAPRILDVEGFSFLIGGECESKTEESEAIKSNSAH